MKCLIGCAPKLTQKEDSFEFHTCFLRECAVDYWLLTELNDRGGFKIRNTTLANITRLRSCLATSRP